MRSGESGVTYELTVQGALGPVLRGALAPDAVATEHLTILRAGLGDDADLVDLFLMLASRGLEVSDVRDLD